MEEDKVTKGMKNINLEDNHKALVLSCFQEQDVLKIHHLTNTFKYHEAWKHFLECNFDTHSVPPEPLVLALLHEPWWLTAVPVPCLARSALIYPQVKAQVLWNDQIWKIFTSCEDELSDIVCSDEQTACFCLTTKRGYSLVGCRDFVRMVEIALKPVREKLESERMNIQEWSYFCHFLLSYRLPISWRFYKKMEGLYEMLGGMLGGAEEGKKMLYWKFQALLELVLGRFVVNGIWDDKEQLNSEYVMVDEDLIKYIFNTEWIETLVRNAGMCSYKEDFERAIFYLSIVGPDHVNYFEAQMAIGNLYLRNNCFKEAAGYFLNVAEKSIKSMKQDAILLAATCVFAKARRAGSEYMVINRSLTKLKESEGFEVKPLEYNEYKKLSLQEIKDFITQTQ